MDGESGESTEKYEATGVEKKTWTWRDWHEVVEWTAKWIVRDRQKCTSGKRETEKCSGKHDRPLTDTRQSISRRSEYSRKTIL